MSQEELEKEKQGQNQYFIARRYSLNGFADWDAVCLSVDGSVLAGCYDDDSDENCFVKLIEVESGRCLSVWQCYAASPYLSIDANGHWLVSSYDIDDVQVWEAASGRFVRDIMCSYSSDNVTAVKMSANGRWFVAGNANGDVEMWETATGNNVCWFDGDVENCSVGLEFGVTEEHWKGHINIIKYIDVSLDGNWIVSCDEDNYVKFWSVASRCCLRSLSDMREKITSLCLSSDGKLIVVGCEDQTVQVWEASTGKCLYRWQGHTAKVLAVCMSGDGHWIASGDNDGAVRLWDVASGRCVQTLRQHLAPIEMIALSADGRRITTGSGDGEVWLWERSQEARS